MGTFDTESVVIDRESPTAGNAVLSDTAVIYSGACDFQSGGGTQYRNPSGVVDIADAVLMINPNTSGSLPAVKVGDRATVTQSGVATIYNVDNVSMYTFPLAYLELLLKRGPKQFDRK